jgi:NitT/TauT family transport system ATP-binding protein
VHTLTVERLRKVYRSKGSGGDVTAIADLSFTVDRGGIVAIVGRTGCGKSTFLRILLGLERPTSGSLLIDDFAPYESFQRAKGLIGAVFQEDRLLPWRTAIDNVTLGLEILGLSRGEQLERARKWLATLGLSDFEDAYPGELSGGMRQRVALARAFTIRPKVLLADEAFGHLDEVTAQQLRKEFLRLVHETGSTTLFVTHQLDEALSVGERTLVFDRPARVVMDIDCRELNDQDRADMKRAIQEAIGREPEETD